MTYKVICTIDDMEYVVADSVSEEELEAVLNRLTRKHEFKNVGRFDIKGNDNE